MRSASPRVLAGPGTPDARMEDRRSRRLSCVFATPVSGWLALPILTVLLIDILHRSILLLAGTVPLERDAAGYWTLGAAVASGDLLLLRDAEVLRTPGYPWLLGLFQACLGRWAMEGVICFQHVLGLLTTVAGARVVGLLGGGGVGVLIALALGAVSFGRIQYDSFILSESLFTFLMVVTFAVTLKWFRWPNTWAAIYAGVALGLSVLCRPTSLYLSLITALVWLTAGGARTPPFRVRSRETLAFAAAFVLVLSPWLARNQIAYGAPFVSVGLGQRLWYACFSNYGAELTVPEEHLRGRLAGVEWWEEAAVFRALKGQGLDELERDAWMAAISKRAIMRQPRLYLAKVARV